MQQIHVRAYGHYLQKGFVHPKYFFDFLPGAGISLLANNKPVVSNISMGLQNLERKKLREDYFIDRMNIDAVHLSNVDIYTLGRVFDKNKKRQAMYSKIIHRQLNVMSVNEKWKGTSDRCPVCLTCREDHSHHLICQSPDMKRKREEILGNFDTDLMHFKTYPPLQEFFIDFFEKCTVENNPYALIP